MHAIKEYLKRYFCPAPLQSTRDVAQRVAEAQLSHRGLPFCPPHEGDLLYQLASAPSVHRCLEIGFATGSTALYLLAGIEGKESGEVVSIGSRGSSGVHRRGNIVATPLEWGCAVAARCASDGIPDTRRPVKDSASSLLEEARRITPYAPVPPS